MVFRPGHDKLTYDRKSALIERSKSRKIPGVVSVLEGFSFLAVFLLECGFCELAKGNAGVLSFWDV